MSDRPLPCSECRKPIRICYTEIEQGQITSTDICIDCPFYQQHLNQVHEIDRDSNPGLCCGGCGTLMKDVKIGAPLGCGECYLVFEDWLITELLIENRIPKKLAIRAKGMRPIHMGRCLQEQTPFNPTARLLVLNEALHETITREDYEQAALLRDQIKQLVEESDSI